MAITSVGYGGLVSEIQIAQLAGSFGSDYGVVGLGAWKVAAATGVDRGVSIAPGVGYGHFVQDTSDAQVVLQGATVASGSRWDTVVMRRNWQPPVGGASSFALIQGASSQTISSARLTAPGVTDDQPLALVRFTAGQSAPTAFVDLRCWSGNAGLVAASRDALAYLDRLGSSVRVGEDLWTRIVDATGTPVWDKRPLAAQPISLLGFTSPIVGAPAEGAQFLMQAGSSVGHTDATGFGRVKFPTPFPNGVLGFWAIGGDDYSNRDINFVMAGGHPISNPTSRSTAAYVVWATDLTDRRRTTYANYLHRINWLAIGF